MPELATQNAVFQDRRSYDEAQSPVLERRQFGNSYDDLSPEARELAHALDGYKLRHRRRFVTYEEILDVVKSLGYRR